MKTLLKVKSVAFIVILTIMVFGVRRAQPQVGGPYQPDSATVLLMHFDGNFNNESEFSADGIGFGSLYFLPNNVPGLGQCLRIDNDSEFDSSFVIVPDTAALDLTGDWTIEGWINVFTFGAGSSDWRWVPRLVIKTGDEVFWRPNYFVEMWGNNRMFSCGYHTADQSAWPQVNTPDNTMEPGKWYHLTFIRFTEKHILVQVVHDANRELIVYAVADYNAFEAPPDTPPILTNQPVHIGFAGGGNDSWLDGFVDEIRISNVVREIPIPPAITSVTQVNNQPASVTSYDVGANITTLFGTTVTKATLHYQIGGNWSQIEMTTATPDSYAAVIPGQPLGTVIRYYVAAEDENGLRATNPLNAESTTPAYYSFGIYQQNTQTLELTFEEGSGVPADGSSYGNIVTMVGNPTYSSDARSGNYCIYLEGDSSYLEVDSPFLHSVELTVDFWFNADTMIEYTRIINRPIDPENWYINNYQVRFQPMRRIAAGSFIEPDRYLVNELVLGTVELSLGKWYHAIYEVTDSTATFLIRDENDQFLTQKTVSISSPPVQATAPLRIGYAAGRPHYKGRYDDIKIYNYAAAGIIASVQPIEQRYLPSGIQLSQNYPNPFNPITVISFEIPEQERVTLSIYNLLGEQVKTLVDKPLAAGKYDIAWDGTDNKGVKVTSGIYFYQLKYKDMVKVQKMSLLR